MKGVVRKIDGRRMLLLMEEDFEEMPATTYEIHEVEGQLMLMLDVEGKKRELEKKKVVKIVDANEVLGKYQTLFFEIDGELTAEGMTLIPRKLSLVAPFSKRSCIKVKNV